MLVELALELPQLGLLLELLDLLLLGGWFGVRLVAVVLGDDRRHQAGDQQQTTDQVR